MKKSEEKKEKATRVTISSSWTVHSEVCGLVGLQSTPLHSGTKHLHHVGVAAFTHIYLRAPTGSDITYFNLLKDVRQLNFVEIK